MKHNTYENRHIGSSQTEQTQILTHLGYQNITQFIDNVIPETIKTNNLHTTHEEGCDEYTALQKLKSYANKNCILKNYIGLGYSDTITPAVIKRNVFENPGWYTAYTPYQAEISQGRLEALLNYQQMITDLTGFAVSNASLLDEGTAAGESMLMAYKISNQHSNNFFVAKNVLPQTLDVLKTKAKYQNITIIVDELDKCNPLEYFGVFIQNPDLYGNMIDYTSTIKDIKQQNQKCIISMSCDILSLVLFKSPCEMGADIAVGSTQRFGIPIGFGGPSAAYIATLDSHKRLLPGRIIGVSKDTRENLALRMALQTREQHIRREKATSNICTAQALLANMAGFYAMYHGKDGLTEIAKQILNLTNTLRINLKNANIAIKNTHLVFDTITIDLKHETQEIYNKLIHNGYLVGIDNNILLISINEKSLPKELCEIFNIITNKHITEDEFLTAYNTNNIDEFESLYRTDEILTHEVFNKYQSETKLMRYLKKLENKDISLVHSMIPLGSCTMKLNAASTLDGVSWEEFSTIHPFAPESHTQGYIDLLKDLSKKLCAITGFSAISLQPNSGAQGEYAGLVAIRRYQESINQPHRNICLIPKSAHGTNPASAYLAGLIVIVVNCDTDGNVDILDLKNKATQYKDTLSCLMITFPSTHGVFESGIKEICAVIHENGGQVYMDGANLNALVGVIKPVEIGVDVSHMNLHKTFAIPHGGGGPGMGPIGVASHLVDFLPSHYIYSNAMDNQNTQEYYAVSSAPFGSASILIISWMYITMLGDTGLKHTTYQAILNANYIAHQLKPYYQILYTGNNGMVAHECIIDIRPIKDSAGITEVDIAKRLMDFGFHAPTQSFPVAGTLMIEPTESEDKAELDRFIEAMVHIYNEILDIKNGVMDKTNNPLKNAPHTLKDIATWDKPYSISDACFPKPWVMAGKIFPTVNRIDDAYGDRNFMCSCS